MLLKNDGKGGVGGKGGVATRGVVAFAAGGVGGFVAEEAKRRGLKVR
jgi:hypothetical protein